MSGWNMPDGATTEQYDRWCGCYDDPELEELDEPEPEEGEDPTWVCRACDEPGVPHTLDLRWERGDEECLVLVCPACGCRDERRQKGVLTPAAAILPSIWEKYERDHTVIDLEWEVAHRTLPERKPAAAVTALQWELDYREVA